MANLTKDQVRQIIANRPPGVSPEDVVTELSKTHTLEGYTAVDAPTTRPTGKLIATPSLPQRLANNAVAQLPNIGGLLGGAGGFMLGGPFGGIAGAGIGGAAGEGARQFATAQNPSPGDVVTQGALQAAYQGTGEGLGRAAAKVAPGLMEYALRPGKLADPDKFPNVVQTVTENAFPVTKGGRAAAIASRKAEGKTLMDMYRQAQASGTQFATPDVVAQVEQALQDNAKVWEPRVQEAVKNDLADFTAQQGPTIDPVTLKLIKQRYQNRAKGAYTADAAIGPRSTEFPQNLAQGAQQQLETIPGIAAQEAKVQSLIGASRALKQAVRRPNPVRFYEPMVGGGAGALVAGAPGGAIGAVAYPLLAHTLASPAVTSKLAITLAKPEWQALIKQSPRLADALIRSMMANSAQQDATAQ